MAYESLPWYGQYIDGAWQAATGRLMDVVEPALQQPMARVVRGNAADVDLAVAAARHAFDHGPWPHTAPAERARVLHAIGDLIQAHSDELAELESRNIGTPLRKTMFLDLPGALEHFRTFAELARLHPYEALPWTDMPSVSWNFVWHEPLGVCAHITAWNFALLFAAWKLAPALAAGCTVVFKPASAAPLSLLRLTALIHDAGLLPRGVLNVVTGTGEDVGEPLVAHPGVDKVSFTGSTANGRRVMALASPTLKHTTLELGGKSPALLLPDADLDVAIDGMLFGMYLNSGQACEAGTRCLVPRAIHDEVVDRLVTRVRDLTLGDPLDLETDQGPLISYTQRARVEHYIALGRAEGAQIVTGGRRARVAGFPDAPFVEPTIFTRVDNTMRLAQEEIFGPVLSIIPYRDVSEAITIANATDFGLAAAVWSRDLQQAIEVGRRLRVGTVWINDFHLILAHAPFGGVKQSGVGREGGLHGLRAYQQQKHMHVDLMQRRAGRVWWDAVLPPG